ncbi:MAG: 3-methyl-2-oxobutanoate hydroxymethyltransferase [Bacteroidota bacterium]|jgi:3-methyl-2-oxobutanoate hydroxymethyltransferase
MYLLNTFKQLKKDKKKITVVTSYDHYTAKIINETNVDGILVGDCSSMVMHGETNTIFSDINILAHHVKWVSKGAPDKLIIASMPFLSVKKGLKDTVENVELLMKAGAQAIKIEGADGNEEAIHTLTQAGIPIIGHVGLMPSMHYMTGGFKAQGRTPQEAESIIAEALKMEALGCIAIVLEAVPFTVGEMVSEAVQIPVVGVGAGLNVDGQALVLQDMLGLITDFKPKFVRRYLNGAELFTSAINEFVDDVHQLKFPAEQEFYRSKNLEAATV